jgi:hypothetical protein
MYLHHRLLRHYYVATTMANTAVAGGTAGDGKGGKG